jgi:hypothetical protein
MSSMLTTKFMLVASLALGFFLIHRALLSFGLVSLAQLGVNGSFLASKHGAGARLLTYLTFWFASFAGRLSHLITN